MQIGKDQLVMKKSRWKKTNPYRLFLRRGTGIQEEELEEGIKRTKKCRKEENEIKERKKNADKKRPTLISLFFRKGSKIDGEKLEEGIKKADIKTGRDQERAIEDEEDRWK